MKMGIDYKRVGFHTKNILIVFSTICHRYIREHPFVSGMVFFSALLYRSSPAVTFFLISSSPVIICTTILLGTLLSFGLNNIPDLIEEEEESVDHVVIEKDGNHGVQTSLVNEERIKREEIKDKNLVDNGYEIEVSEPLPNYEIEDEKTSCSAVHEERQKFAYLLYGDLKSEADAFLTPRHVKESAKLELDACHLKRGNHGKEIAEGLKVGEIRDDAANSGKTFGRSNSRRAVRFVINDITDKAKVETKSETGHEKEIILNVNDIEDQGEIPDSRDSSSGHIGNPYWRSDSGSEHAENSSPDTSVADLTPMIGDLHPLLDPYEVSRPTCIELLNENSDKSSESCGSEDEYVVDEDDHNERVDLDKEGSWVQEGKNAGQGEMARIHVIDLGSSKLERHQPFGSVIVRRHDTRSQKMVEEKNIMGLQLVDDHSDDEYDDSIQVQREGGPSQAGDGGGQEEVTGFTWTGDDTGYVMDLGGSELKRNKRLENLMAKRRAKSKKKSMEVEGLIYLQSDDDESCIIEVNEGGIIQESEIGEEEEMAGVALAEDDRKHDMNLGSTLLERNRRLENLMAKLHALRSRNPMKERDLIDLRSVQSENDQNDDIDNVDVEDIGKTRQDANVGQEEMTRLVLNEYDDTLHGVVLGSPVPIRAQSLENLVSKYHAQRNQMTTEEEYLIDLRSDGDHNGRGPTNGFEVENGGGWNQEDENGEQHMVKMTEDDTVHCVELGNPVLEQNQSLENLMPKDCARINQITTEEEDLIDLQSNDDYDNDVVIQMKKEAVKIRGKSGEQEETTGFTLIKDEIKHVMDLCCSESESSQQLENLMVKSNAIRNQDAIEENDLVDLQSVEEVPLIDSDGTQPHVIEPLPFLVPNLSSIKGSPLDVSCDGDEEISAVSVPTSARASSTFLAKQKSFSPSCQRAEPIALRVPNVPPIRGSPCRALCDEEEEIATLLVHATPSASPNRLTKQSSFASSHQQAGPIPFQVPNLPHIKGSPFNASCDGDEEVGVLPMPESAKAPLTPFEKLSPFTRYERIVMFETLVGETSSYGDFVTSSRGKGQEVTDGNTDSINKETTINSVESIDGPFCVDSPVGIIHDKPLKDQKNDDLFTSPCQGHVKAIDVNIQSENADSKTSSFLHTRSDSVVEFRDDYEGMDVEQKEVVFVHKVSDSLVPERPIETVEHLSDSSACVPPISEKLYIAEHEGCHIKGLHSIALCSRKYAGVAHAAELCQPLLAKDDEDFVHVDSHSSDIEGKSDYALISFYDGSSSFDDQTTPASDRAPGGRDESVLSLSSTGKPEASKDLQVNESHETENVHEGYVQLSSDDADPADKLSVYVIVLSGSQLSEPTALFDWGSSSETKDEVFHAVPIGLDDELPRRSHDVSKEECTRTPRIQDVLSFVSYSPTAQDDLNVINTSRYGTSHHHLGADADAWLEGDGIIHMVGLDDQDFMTELFTIGGSKVAQEIPSIERKQYNLETHANDGTEYDAETSSFATMSVLEPNPVQHNNLCTKQFSRGESGKPVRGQLVEHENNHMDYTVPELSRVFYDQSKTKDALNGIETALKETSEGNYVDGPGNNDRQLRSPTDRDALEVIEARTPEDIDLVLNQFDKQNPEKPVLNEPIENREEQVGSGAKKSEPEAAETIFQPDVLKCLSIRRKYCGITQKGDPPCF